MESGPLVVKNGFGTSCLLFWQILIENGGVYAEFVTKTHWCCLIMSINSIKIMVFMGGVRVRHGGRAPLGEKSRTSC